MFWEVVKPASLPNCQNSPLIPRPDPAYIKKNNKVTFFHQVVTFGRKGGKQSQENPSIPVLDVIRTLSRDICHSFSSSFSYACHIATGKHVSDGTSTSQHTLYHFDNHPHRTKITLFAGNVRVEIISGE